MEPRNFGEVVKATEHLPVQERRAQIERWARSQAGQQGIVTGTGDVHIHLHEAGGAPAEAHDRAAGWALLERLTPYFVIGLLIILGMGALAVALMLAVPPFMAFVSMIMASLVAVVISAVSALGMVALLAAVMGRVLHTGRNDKTVGTMAKTLADSTRRPAAPKKASKIKW